MNIATRYYENNQMKLFVMIGLSRLYVFKSKDGQYEGTMHFSDAHEIDFGSKELKSILRQVSTLMIYDGNDEGSDVVNKMILEIEESEKQGVLLNERNG